MNENLTYQKDFSPLPGLQQQRSLRYSLIRETSAAGECFGIQVEDVYKRQVRGSEAACRRQASVFTVKPPDV